MDHRELSQRPFAMSAMFALISAALIGLATILLSTTLTSFFEGSLLTQNRSDALALSQGLMKRIYEELFKDQPYGSTSLDIQDPNQLDQIQALFSGLSPSLGLENLAIMDAEGGVIFSTNIDKIGDNIGTYPILRRALNGEACFDIIEANSSPLLSKDAIGEKIQIVVPFGPKKKEFLGTAVLYRSPHQLRQLQATGIRTVVGTCLPVMVGLFALLAIFVWRADKRLAESAATVRRQNEELKRNQLHMIRSNRLAAIGELAGGIAHELNNPLGGMRIYLEGLRRRAQKDNVDAPALRQEALKITDRLLKEIDRCKNIIQNLLTFSHQDEERQEATTAVNGVVREVLTLVDIRLKQSTVKVETLLAEKLPPVPLSSGELGQILMNIVTNSIQAMADGGTLSIQTTEKDDSVQIVVTDTGGGIPSSLRDRVLEPFFTTKAPGEGTGLGLSISYGIVTRCGGDLSLQSGEQGGTTCFITLPPAQGEEKEDA